MMKNLFRKARHGEKGFILSELLVNVVAIIGVLTVVAVPNVSNSIGQVKVESCDTEDTTTTIIEMLGDRAADALDGDGGYHE